MKGETQAGAALDLHIPRAMKRWERSSQALETTVARKPEEAWESYNSEETSGPQRSEETSIPEGLEETGVPGENEKSGGPVETKWIKDPGKNEETRDLGENEKTRGVKETEGILGPGDTEEETRGPGKTWTPEETAFMGTEGSEETRDLEESKETRNSGMIKISSPMIDVESKEPEKTKNSSQEMTSPKEIGDSERPKETREPERAKEIRESELSKEPRDLEEVKAMAEKGCISLTKYFLFVFNIFFFVLGSLVFCFGLWILIDKNSFASFLGMSFTPLKVWSYVLSISGVLTGLLSFLGCLGALKEIRCLLGVYFSLLLLLFTAQITVGVLIYTQHGLLEKKVKDIVLDVIENYHKYPDAYSTAENWDFVQFQLRCCGWTSPQDWLLASSLQSNGSAPSSSERTSTSSPSQGSDFLPLSHPIGTVLRVPCSCQNTSVLMSPIPSSAEVPGGSQPAAGPGALATMVSAPGLQLVLPGPGNPGTTARLRSGELCSLPADNGIYHQGCSRSIYTWLHNNLISIVGVSLGLGLLELGVMSLSMFLCRNLDHVYNKLSRYS